MTETITKPAGEKPAEKNGKPKNGRVGRPAADPAADAVDLASLSFVVAEKPKRKGTSDNPFTKPLGDSYETETARATVIPAVALRRVEGMIRRAAGELKIGVTIAATEPNEDGDVQVTFMGKDKRKSKKDEAAEPETPAAEGTAEPATPAAEGSASVPGASPDADSEPPA